MAALSWAAYKEYVRRSVLKDATALRADDDRMVDAARLAFNDLCPHTALAKTTTYVGDNSTFQFTLPDDLYAPLEQAGTVMVTDTNSSVLVNHLKPAYSSFEIAPNDPLAFSVWPEDTLNTGVPVATGQSLTVRYYAYYPYMVADADVMPIPQWAYAAVGFMMGVHLLTSDSWQEADNATDKFKPEMGQPENNSLRMLQKWWIQMYDLELARHPKQVRIASFR